ncbi:DUF4907 domain-containing protein [Zhouia sp. PK063]|uniref:DUF4907 domain-containing protein n=1 Tax=Zhouia sp. PK063 TaxID=3373602 RepID=UPI0037AC84E6
MKTKVFGYIILIVVCVTIGVFAAKQYMFSNQEKINPLTTEVYAVKNGYGYRIKLNENILIQQNFIPAAYGKKGFKTRTEAQTIANLVVQKLLAKSSPTVTMEDLKNNQIHIQ